MPHKPIAKNKPGLSAGRIKNKKEESPKFVLHNIAVDEQIIPRSKVKTKRLKIVRKKALFALSQNKPLGTVFNKTKRKSSSKTKKLR